MAIIQGTSNHALVLAAVKWALIVPAALRGNKERPTFACPAVQVAAQELIVRMYLTFRIPHRVLHDPTIPTSLLHGPEDEVLS